MRAWIIAVISCALTSVPACASLTERRETQTRDDYLSIRGANSRDELRHFLAVSAQSPRHVLLPIEIQAALGATLESSLGPGANVQVNPRSVRRPAPTRSSLYVLPISPLAGEPCESDSHGIICWSLDAARDNCAPVLPDTILCDTNFILRFVVWSIIDEAAGENIELRAKLHEIAAEAELADRASGGLGNTAELIGVMLDGLDRDDPSIVPLLQYFQIVLGHEAGHIAKGHSLKGLLPDQLQAAEREADKHLLQILSHEAEFSIPALLMFVANYQLHRSAIGRAAFAREPFDPVGAAKVSFGCDATHGTINARLSPMLERLVAEGDPRGVSATEALSETRTLSDDVCSQPSGRTTEFQLDWSVLAPPAVALLAAGAEPRVELRYRPTLGATARTETQSTTSITLGLGGDEPKPMGSIEVKTTTSIRVEGSSDGETKYLITFDTAGTPTSPVLGLPPPVAMRTQLEAAVSFSASITLSDRGIARDVDLRLREGVPAQSDQVMEVVGHALGQILPVLPVEPVGTGATWRVSRDSVVGGIRVEDSTVYRIVSVHDSIVALETRTRARIPDQTVQIAGMPTGWVMVLRASSGNGSGRIRLDLSRPAADSWSRESRARLMGDARIGPDMMPVMQETATVVTGHKLEPPTGLH